MKCTVCHGGQIESKNVREEISSGDDMVLVPVDAMVCRSCGERYYDRRTVRYLEDIEEKIRRHTIPLRDVGHVKMIAA